MLKKVAEELKQIDTVEQLKKVLSDNDWTTDELMDYIDDTWKADSALKDWFMTFKGLDDFCDEATVKGYINFLLSDSENYGYVKDAIEQVGCIDNGKCYDYLSDDIDFYVEKTSKIMDDMYQYVSEYDAQIDDGSTKYTNEEWDNKVNEDYQDTICSSDTMMGVAKELFG